MKVIAIRTVQLECSPEQWSSLDDEKLSQLCEQFDEFVERFAIQLEAAFPLFTIKTQG